jgi:large subunit ribosomal protein L24
VAVKYKIKKEDNVQIVAGKDKGKTGKVLKVDREKGRVVIQGLNMVKKAVRPKKQGEKGGIIEIEAPLSISNVMVVCKKCGPTRVGISLEGKEKKRICRKCGEVL